MTFMRFCLYIVLAMIVCEFIWISTAQMPMESTICTDDLRQCPDGSMVGRDPQHQCSFYECSSSMVQHQSQVIDSSSPLPSNSPSTASAQEMCSNDFKKCNDGSMVIRNPRNNCEFNACHTGKTITPSTASAQEMCSNDFKKCNDGSMVIRNPRNNCEFNACHTGKTIRMCNEDSMQCENGRIAFRDSKKNCDFSDCESADPREMLLKKWELYPRPIRATCVRDAFECPDGSIVYRDPMNDCEFSKCIRNNDIESSHMQQQVQQMQNFIFPREDPDSRMNPVIDGQFSLLQYPVCMSDAHQCDDGSLVFRDPMNACEFPKCTMNPSTIMMLQRQSSQRSQLNAMRMKMQSQNCKKDARKCKDGTLVYRDSEINCDYTPCPTMSSESSFSMCPDDVQTCPGGGVVTRDPEYDCAFKPCDSDSRTTHQLSMPMNSAFDSSMTTMNQDPMICSRDASLCRRDPMEHCAFNECAILERDSPRPDDAPSLPTRDSVTQFGPQSMQQPPQVDVKSSSNVRDKSSMQLGHSINMLP